MFEAQKLCLVQISDNKVILTQFLGLLWHPYTWDLSLHQLRDHSLFMLGGELARFIINPKQNL